MAEKSTGLWKTDVKTATAVKAVAGALVVGLAAGDFVTEPVAQAIMSLFAILFGVN